MLSAYDVRGCVLAASPRHPFLFEFEIVNRKLFLRLKSVCQGLLLICCGLSPTLAVCGEPEPRPNIILINLDDAGWDIFDPTVLAARFPNIHQLASEGIRFTNCHVTTPLCGPSRACLLRGQYAHRTGIKTNQIGSVTANGMPGGTAAYFDRGHADYELSVWMKSAGYRTAMIGKYLNNGSPPSVPPGWDHFRVSLGSLYYQTARFTNRDSATGSPTSLPAGVYRTDAETDDCLQLLTRHVNQHGDQPFFFYLAPFAPHSPAFGTPMYNHQYRHRWPDLTMPKDPDFDEVDLTDKPVHLRDTPRLRAAGRLMMDEVYRERLLSMVSVDTMIARIRMKLESLALADNTFIFLTSDNGFQLGHHRMFGKNYPYNRCTNVPLIVWGPGIEPFSSSRHLLANIDIAPTLVELAGGQVPSMVDGMSFKPLLDDPQAVPEREWRHSILIENWEDTFSFNESHDTSYTGLRLFDKVFVAYSNGEYEYYDLASDPYQLRNRFHQLSPGSINFYNNVMQLLKSRPAPAAITISNDRQVKATRHSLRFRGLAEHHTGVEKVRVVIRDRVSGLYYTGNQWQSDYAAMVFDPQHPGGQLTDWRIWFPVAQIPGDLARLVVVARAIGADQVLGNPQVYRLTVDIGDPETEIRTPQINQRRQSPVLLSGFADDEHRIGAVRLVIKNVASGEYFDGAKWVSSHTMVAASLVTRRYWEFNFSAAPGKYWFSARAYDSAGNFDRTPAIGQFEVR